MLSCPRVPAGGRWPPLLSPLHRRAVSRCPALGVFTSPSCCWLCLDISKYYLDNVITDIISDNCSGYNMQPRRWSCVQTACCLLVSSIKIKYISRVNIIIDCNPSSELHFIPHLYIILHAKRVQYSYKQQFSEAEKNCIKL